MFNDASGTCLANLLRQSKSFQGVWGHSVQETLISLAAEAPLVQKVVDRLDLALLGLVHGNLKKALKGLEVGGLKGFGKGM